MPTRCRWSWSRDRLSGDPPDPISLFQHPQCMVTPANRWCGGAVAPVQPSWWPTVVDGLLIPLALVFRIGLVRSIEVFDPYVCNPPKGAFLLLLYVQGQGSGTKTRKLFWASDQGSKVRTWWTTSLYNSLSLLPEISYNIIPLDRKDNKHHKPTLNRNNIPN
jgi:hypothetical protein